MAEDEIDRKILKVERNLKAADVSRPEERLAQHSSLGLTFGWGKVILILIAVNLTLLKFAIFGPEILRYAVITIGNLVYIFINLLPFTIAGAVIFYAARLRVQFERMLYGIKGVLYAGA